MLVLAGFIYLFPITVFEPWADRPIRQSSAKFSGFITCINAVAILVIKETTARTTAGLIILTKPSVFSSSFFVNVQPSFYFERATGFQNIWYSMKHSAVISFSQAFFKLDKSVLHVAAPCHCLWRHGLWVVFLLPTA